MTPFPRVLLSVSRAGRGPSGSTRTPGFVGIASALFATTRIRLSSATATCCDRLQVKVFHLRSNHGASRRM